MKSKEMKPLPPLSTAKSRTVLDWPAELGLSDDFVRQVEVRCKKNRRRRRASAGAVITLMALFVAFWGVPYVRKTSSVEVPLAQRQTLMLPDGSRVELNSQAKLYADFRYGRRMVRLEQGEAYFAVVKDAEHPFFVESSLGTVRVLGTEFNVRLGSAQDGEVTLLRGSVLLDRGHAMSVHLVPGQQFDAADSQVRTLSESALQNVTAWRQGQFAFDGLTLAAAAAHIGAYHGHAIVVAPEIAGLHLHGSYPLDDLPALLRALETALDVRVVPAADGSYRVTRR